ncbi:hypothetical protein MIND_01247100 [Mycena indigotica]|uniref:Uncharacterized protein n=1 Tax=Mycena indigotica TaxID=2126181 RepID=A0A8H6S3T1_9AGAR|nr:uncharacterized protein MIND_01247100 [Mycena indigotica]KAF7292198.1 hypothetical protein MIND_01247100 [Mycena indigotica]
MATRPSSFAHYVSSRDAMQLEAAPPLISLARALSLPHDRDGLAANRWLGEHADRRKASHSEAEKSKTTTGERLVDALRGAVQRREMRMREEGVDEVKFCFKISSSGQESSTEAMQVPDGWPWPTPLPHELADASNTLPVVPARNVPAQTAVLDSDVAMVSVVPRVDRAAERFERQEAMIENLHERVHDLLEDRKEMKERYEELLTATKELQEMHDELKRANEELSGANASLQMKLSELASKGSVDPREATMPGQTVSPAVDPERRLYLEFMASLPSPPPTRPAFRELQSVLPRVRDWYRVAKQEGNSGSTRAFLLLAGRTVWCDDTQKTHALAFAPQVFLCYSGLGRAPEWLPSGEMARRVGEEVELFVALRPGKESDIVIEDARDDAVYYAGVYKVHSLRSVHEPGSAVPPDVSMYHFLRAMNVDVEIPGDMSRRQLREILRKALPEGEDELPGVECFGLQCIGFDAGLYETLRTQAAVCGVKRCASEAGVDGGIVGGRTRRRVKG